MSTEPRNTTVEHAPRPVKVAPRQPGFRRHLEGWQLAVVAVSIALLGAGLVVPRPVPPEDVPVPEIDRAEQRRAARTEAARADAAEQEPLPFEVRVVGELLRRYGAEEGSREGALAEQHLIELREKAPAARARHGEEALLRLRAAQTRFFGRTLARWRASGAPEAELTELGGSFLAKAEQVGWIGGGRQLVPDAEECALLFRVRWGELTGLGRSHPFRPTLNEWRAYYRFLIEHPEGRSDPERTAARLDYVRALAGLDPGYPGDLARGSVSYQLGRFPEAARAFRTHLAAHPHGRWRLRAQNHLAAALEAGGGF